MIPPIPPGARLPPLPPGRARELVAAFARARVLIVGDVMVDRFLIGAVSRISPEAPVPILEFDREEQRMGGAANVAHNMAALGGAVTLVGATGRDEGADLVRNAAADAGITARLVADAGRRTTMKVRLVTGRNQQVARIDYENDHEITGSVEETVLQHVHAAVEGVDAIVVSDYLKGTITARLMKDIVSTASTRGIPVLVDPKIPHIDYYAGATLVTPNHHEAAAATNLRVRTQEEAREAARAFRARARCAGVVMTRGEQGLWLIDEKTDGHLPAVAREVADVTGAGDTVIAALALTLAAGGTAAEGARLATEAAAIVVGKFGPATVTPAELLDSVVPRAREQSL